MKNVSVLITGNRVLSRVLEENNLHKLFPQYQEYEIQVDVVGIIHDAKKADLAFIECKLDSIMLRDISQLLGYSRVAKPMVSIAMSPKAVSAAVNLLLNVHRRYDVLGYSIDKSIIVGRWLESRRDLDMANIIPLGTPIWK